MDESRPFDLTITIQAAINNRVATSANSCQMISPVPGEINSICYLFVCLAVGFQTGVSFRFDSFVSRNFCLEATCMTHTSYCDDVPLV